MVNKEYCWDTRVHLNSMTYPVHYLSLWDYILNNIKNKEIFVFPLHDLYYQ